MSPLLDKGFHHITTTYHTRHFAGPYACEQQDKPCITPSKKIQLVMDAEAKTYRKNEGCERAGSQRPQRRVLLCSRHSHSQHQHLQVGQG